MAANPGFASIPKIGIARVSAANTARDAPSSPVLVLTAGSNGTRLNRIQVQAVATTTAGMVRLWLYNGTTYFLFEEVPVSAITPSSTVEAFSATLSDQINLDLMPVVLPSGWFLYATTEKAEAFNIIAHGGDL